MRALVILQSNTERTVKSLDHYFNELKKIKMISRDDEVRLARLISSGDEQALSKLVRTNLRFVISVAKQYQNQGVALEDLINEGNIGLIAAARRFDADKGFKFITFAVWSIRQAIIFAIAEQSRLIHIPYNHITLKSKYQRSAQLFEQLNRRWPTPEEMSGALNLPITKIREMLSSEHRQYSIYKPLNAQADLALIDVLPDDNAETDHMLIKESLNKIVRNALQQLNCRNKEVIRLYFGLDLPFPVPLEEIAGKLGLSVEHTRRLKDWGLEQLKNSVYGPLLKTYLD